uniref:Putative ovule protein n=1 Tax=Solanum chacoense TaxID=4108 RepID=A0A0V0I441_SOLCH
MTSSTLLLPYKLICFTKISSTNPFMRVPMHRRGEHSFWYQIILQIFMSTVIKSKVQTLPILQSLAISIWHPMSFSNNFQQRNVRDRAQSLSFKAKNFVGKHAILY